MARYAMVGARRKTTRWLCITSLTGGFQLMNKSSRRILGVVYIECTARCQFQCVAELLPEINRFPSRPLKWLGNRKFHRAKPDRNKHSNTVYEGSKLLVFIGSSLPHVRRLYMKTKRYSHLDLFLCMLLRRLSLLPASICPFVGDRKKGPLSETMRHRVPGP